MLLGKILRININPPAGSGVPYVSPATNRPNIINAAGRLYKSIWARAATGDIVGPA